MCTYGCLGACPHVCMRVVFCACTCVFVRCVCLCVSAALQVGPSDNEHISGPAANRVCCVRAAGRALVCAGVTVRGRGRYDCLNGQKCVLPEDTAMVRAPPALLLLRCKRACGGRRAASRCTRRSSGASPCPCPSVSMCASYVPACACGCTNFGISTVPCALAHAGQPPRLHLLRSELALLDAGHAGPRRWPV